MGETPVPSDRVPFPEDVTNRMCTACGAAYTGETHKDCPSSASTLRKPPSSKSRLDEIPAEAAPWAATPGRQLNQYILVQQIGKGGMGAVWKAWDRRLTRWVAIKFLLASQDEDIFRFQREAKLAARLRHPNIAPIYEVGEAEPQQAGQSSCHYLAMEYIDGMPLGGAKLSVEQCLDLFVKIAQGVDAAHKSGIIHRDLKPANVMLTSEGWPYVMDFGLAKALSTDSSISVSGAVLGTPAYMPPEQAQGKLEMVDARSDVYSLGATMYAVLARKQPFAGDSAMEVLMKVCTEEPPPPRTLNPEIPAEVETIILKAMAKKREDRYPSAGALAEDLRRYLTHQPIAARPPAPPPRPGGMKKIVAAVAALALLGVAAVVVVPRLLGPAKEIPATGWAGQYQRFQALFRYDGFKALSEEDLKECRKTLTEMPEERADPVAKWLEKQAADNIPEKVWDQRLWGDRDKKETARRIIEWTQDVQGALKGLTMAVSEQFKGLNDRLGRAQADFDPVVRYHVSGEGKAWSERFDGLRVNLHFSTFKQMNDEAIRSLNQVMRDMPAPASDEAAGWFEKQVADNVPAELWDKKLWGEYKAAATKLLDWSAALRRILEGVAGDRFTAVTGRLAKASTEFEPVAKHVESDVERMWQPRWDGVLLRLVLSDFQAPDADALQEMRKTVAETPPTQVDVVIQWFDNQLSRIPQQAWAKPLWLSRQPEARRYVDWCAAVEGVLAGVPAALTTRVDPLRKKVAAAAERFRPVLAYRGSVHLKVFVLPHASVKEIKAGETWLVKDGKKAEPGPGRIAGDDLSTPLVIDDLDIADLTLVLTLPGKGDATLAIPGRDLVHGERYVFGGEAGDPASFKLRRLP